MKRKILLFQEILPTTLLFDRTGDEVSLAFCNKEGKDVHDDGLLVQVCQKTKPRGLQVTGQQKIFSCVPASSSLALKPALILLWNQTKTVFEIGLSRLCAADQPAGFLILIIGM